MNLYSEIARQHNLDIENFPCKWQEARDLAFFSNTAKYPEETAADLACRLFLELGGRKVVRKTAIVDTPFLITSHDDGEGITVTCTRIGTHIRVEPVSSAHVVITTDDR